MSSFAKAFVAAKKSEKKQKYRSMIGILANQLMKREMNGPV